MIPEQVVDTKCEVGENPLWHPIEGRVYWVDIPAGHLNRYDPVSGSHEMFEIGTAVGGFTMQPDGALLLFMARGAVALWREGALTPVIDEIPDERDNRFNDVIADPEGRVFAGTMSTPDRAGRLYRLDGDRRLTQLLDGIGTSNGLGFTPDRTGLYYTDTGRQDIYRFDYDRATGAISGQRVFVHVDDGEGRPDGLTVDADGAIWSARWDGGCLVRYAADGTELGRIRFPARQVSSVTFGGPDYTDLYVTTAGGQDRGANGSGAGALFVVKNAGRGVPEFCSRR